MNPSDPSFERIKEALYKGQKIEAIKLLRGDTGLGLAESKAKVEELERELRASTPEKFTAASGKGCAGVLLSLCLLLVAVIAIVSQ